MSEPPRLGKKIAGAVARIGIMPIGMMAAHLGTKALMGDAKWGLVKEAVVNSGLQGAAMDVGGQLYGYARDKGLIGGVPEKKKPDIRTMIERVRQGDLPNKPSAHLRHVYYHGLGN